MSNVIIYFASAFFTIGLEERQKKNSAMSLITSLS
ncbi:DUF3953 domain-containing protein [Paenibacillus sp. BT-177]